MRYFDCANSGIPSNLALHGAQKIGKAARPNVFHAQLVAPIPLRSTCTSEILLSQCHLEVFEYILSIQPAACP